MPHYDYQCESCGLVFEEFQKMSDPHIEKCPKCQGKVKRLLGGGAGIIFKGSGFYKTDYSASSSCEKKSDSSPACASCAAGSAHSH